MRVDQDDPETRIAELERRLAEHQRFAEPKPSLDPGVAASPVGPQAAAPRTFVATAPRMNMKRFAILFVYGGIAALMGLPFVVNAVFHVPTKTVGHWMHWLVLGGYALLIPLFAGFRMRSFFTPSLHSRYRRWP
jgi:hypothetical protein